VRRAMGREAPESLRENLFSLIKTFVPEESKTALVFAYPIFLWVFGYRVDTK